MDACRTIVFSLISSVICCSLLSFCETAGPRFQGMNDFRVFNPTTLSPGKIETGSVRGGDTIPFHFTAREGDYFQITAVQQHIDFKLDLHPPDTDTVYSFDTPNGLQGKEMVHHLGGDSGLYKLMIIPLGRFSEQGSYSIELKTLKTANDADRIWMAAYQMRKQADNLRRNLDTRDEAVRMYENLISKWQAIGDQFQATDTKRALGFTLRSLGHHDKAKMLFEELIEQWEALDETRNAAFSCIIMAGFHKDAKDYENAIEWTEKGIKKWQKAGDTFQETRAHSDLASFYMMSGDHETAKEVYNKTIQMAENSDSGSLRGIIYRENGNAWQTFGDHERVMEFYHKALQNYETMPHPAAMASTAQVVGDYLMKKNLKSEAKSYYHLALDVWTEIGYKWQLDRLRQRMDNMDLS